MGSTDGDGRWSVDAEAPVLALVLLLGVAGAIGAGVGTYAYFTESDTAGQNTVDAGTVDVTLDGTNGGLTSSFGAGNAKPTTTVAHNFTVRNQGSLTADHLEVSFAVAENDARSEPADADVNTELSASETASLLRVTKLEYENHGGTVITDLLSSVSDTNGNGIKDLQEVIDQTGTADDLPAPQTNGGNTTYLVIELQVANDDSAAFVKGGNTAGSLTGYDEDVMADGVDVSVTFTLNQDGSQ